MTIIVVRVKCVVRVVEIENTGGRCRAIVLYLAISFQPVYQVFPGFAQDQAVLSVEVIRMHPQVQWAP
jgi:hypothetical protein